MTKKDALTIALSTLTASTYTNPSYDGKETTRKEIPATEVVEILQKMIDQLSKPHTTSPEAKSKANEKRKAATAAARSALMEQVLPVLRDALTEPMTAKALFEKAKDGLPADFTAAKVQYILLHEMADEVVKTEAKGEANTYAPKAA